MKNIRLTALIALLLPAAVCAYAQKKPLDHDAYDSWQTVQSMKISNDGSLASWQVNPQEGDGKLYIRNLKTGAELVVDRASAITWPEDAGWATCTIKAPFAVTRQMKIDKKKKEDMPKDTLAYINLKTFEVKKIAGAGTASFGYLSAPYIYTLKEVEGKKDLKNLLVIKPETGNVDTIHNVTSFKCSKTGDMLAVVTKKDEKDSLSRSSVLMYYVPTMESKQLSEGGKAYGNLAFNDTGDKFLFTVTDQDVKKDGTPSYAVYYTRIALQGKPSRKTAPHYDYDTEQLVPQGSSDIPAGWVISKNSHPRFSNDSRRVLFGIYPYTPAKDTTVVDFEAPQVDIWRWDAETVPPMDKVAEGDGMLNGMINLDNPHKLFVLSQNKHNSITFVDGADYDYALSTDTAPYELSTMWDDVSVKDLAIVDLRDGSRRVLENGAKGTTVFSMKGKYIMWFNPEDGAWYSWNVATGEKVNLTAQTGVAFYDEEDDHPMGYSPYGRPIWMGDDEYVLICDKYDIWKFKPDGSKAENLTKGNGRANKIKYRYFDPVRHDNIFLYQNVTSLPLKGDIYLTTFEEETSKNGFATVNTAKPSVPVGFEAEWYYNVPVKAKNAPELLYTKGNFQHPMDAYVTSDLWKSETRLSSINPQQADYLWGDVQMVHWNAYDGTPLKGLLYTPENLDRSKKYPMMIYFYEKSAETLYRYMSPAPSRSIINIPFYVSRGYVVFVPDIVYTVGHPGESAWNCVCAGAEAMCSQFAFVDKSKMAIQGQSWGGYQTAYLVTRTDMFAAAGAGAPVGNMTSAYGGIRWESGNSRIPQYEHGQSRIGKTLWEEGGRDLYIENSPVFFAPNVKTPVLIMHNDADGAVPWYQGIEFFMSLRRLGKPAWLLEYNNEAHNLLERRNCKDLSIRLQQFFDYYLKGEPEPVWMKEGVPYSRKGNYFGYELEK